MLDILDFLASAKDDIIRPLFSERQRRQLRLMGLGSIRQSQYGMGRECPQKLYLSGRVPAERASAYMLFGSVFAKASEAPDEALARCTDEGYYLSLFKQVRAVDPNVVFYHQGNPVDWGMVKSWALMMSTRERLGMTFGELVHTTQEALYAAGIRTLQREERLSYKEGHGDHALELFGTLDQRGFFHGKPIVLDIKLYGVSSVYLETDGSIKKQSFTPLEMQFHPQLRHYEWLLWKQKREAIDFYGIVAPANLVPYIKGPEKGKARGLPFFFSPTLGTKGRIAYEEDFKRFFSSFVASPPYRAMPTNFGTVSCPSCPYFNACLGDVSSATQAAALSDLSYLKD